MSNIKVFVLAWDYNQFDSIPNAEHLIKINLNKLQLIDGVKNDCEQLSEDRIFLSTAPNEIIRTTRPDFIGFVSPRWNEKHDKKPITEWGIGGWRAGNVYVASAIKDWYKETCDHHKGMDKYLIEMAKLTGLKLGLPNGFYFNNFVCAPKVYLEFQAFFRKAFKHFHNKYGYDFDYYVIPEHQHRKAACLYERVAALYFSNRTDLNMIDIV